MAIQCNLESGANPRVPHSISGGNQPTTFPALDTRGLHTLAELCLRRADYEFSTQTVDTDNRNTSNTGSLGTDFREPFKLHVSKKKRLVSDSVVPTLRKQQVGAKESAEEKCEDLKERRKEALRRASNASDEGSSRLHKLDDELEKMLQ